MSTAVESAIGLLPTPQSSRKRKSDTETPTKSKKKRKHTELQDESTLQPVTPSQSLSSTQPKKRKEKKSKSDDVVTMTEQSQEAEDLDIELPDAPADIPVDMEADLDNEPVDLDGEPEGDVVEEIDDTMIKSQEPSCFYSKRMSLYIPIPAISQTSSASSLLSLHLAPLLLTYFPPADGIVLSFSDPVLSAKSDTGVNLPLLPPTNGEIPRNPPEETFARCADGFGVCWVWLTVTFLVFRPQPGDEVKGWTNVQSEGFVGLVSYNYFQTAVGKTRIPKSWTWDGPTREKHRHRRRSRKGKLRDDPDDVPGNEEVLSNQVNGMHEDEANDGGSGSFVDSDGNKVGDAQTFHVVDVEMVPGHEIDRWTLQVDGSLLQPAEEAAVVAEEQRRFDALQNKSRSRSKTPGLEDGEMTLMSGGLALSRETSVL